MKSSYVFGAALALTGIAGLVDRAEAATAAGFTFETSGLAFSTSVTSPVLGPLVAESGVGTASASHAALTTVYSSPAGNGSAHSLSSNSWAVGDYYSFAVPTTGLTGILVSFDAASSTTGPKTFSLAYTTDGTSFSTVGTYTVLATVTTTATAGTTSTGFNSSSTSTSFAVSFNLSGITGLNNNALAAFRLVDADGTVTATGGTSRVDNFVVSSVPEPGSLAVAALGLAGLAARRRRD